MATPNSVVQAVQDAIVASAHLAAYEHVSAAAEACQRLGSLTSGRWRSAARDLSGLEDQLQVAYASSAETVAGHAAELDIAEEALWTAGEAAASLDMLREGALAEVDADGPSARLLEGQVLFGVAFLEDDESTDRGTTLLFGWPEPLAPSTWPWQASWLAGDGQDNGEDEEELDLYPADDIEVEEVFLAAVGRELDLDREAALSALVEAATALTRASLLAASGAEPELDEEPAADEPDGAGA
jgi:hypothetical protein